MKLTSIASNIIARKNYKLLTESAESDADKVQSQLADLTNDLNASGEDITDEEVQAAVLSALIDADGDLNAVDVSDVEAIKTEIKESRGYISEAGGALGAIHLVGDVLGNAAFIHELAGAIQKVTGKDVDETKLKAKLDRTFGGIKKVTGFPAKVMEKAFAWIAKKFGASEKSQHIAGISGTLLVTVALFALAIMLFPSVTSGVLLVIAIMGVAGKSAEIIKLTKELIHHVKDSMSGKGDETPAGA